MKFVVLGRQRCEWSGVGGQVAWQGRGGRFFENVKEMVRAKDKAVTLKTFTDLHVFGWLLTAAQERVVKAGAGAELSKGNVDGLLAGGKASSSSRGARASRGAGSQATKTQVVALFAN